MAQESDEALGGLLNMESQLAASLAVGSAVEYKYWLLTYARYLSSEADVNRLTEVCKALLGPPTPSSSSSSASPFATTTTTTSSAASAFAKASSSPPTFASGSDFPTAADFAAASSAFSSSSSAFAAPSASSGSSLTSTHSTSNGKVWEPAVLGMAKRELLRELLPIMSSNRSLQRLVAQFKGGLDVVGK